MKPSTPQQTASALVHLLREKGTADYIGEPVTQLAHSLQCAHLAATSGQADEETVLAALLHDIGQFLPGAEVRSLAMNVRDMRASSSSSSLASPPSSTCPLSGRESGGDGDDDQDENENENENENDEAPVDGESVGRVGHELIGSMHLLRLGFSRKVAALVKSHVTAKRFLCAVDPGYWQTLSEASRKSLVFQGGVMTEEEVVEWRGKDICEDMCRLRKWDDEAKVVGWEVEPVEAYEGMIVRHLERMAAV